MIPHRVGPVRLLLLAIIALCLLAPPAHARTFDRIVAVVNDDIVTLSDLEEVGKPLFERIPKNVTPEERRKQVETLRGQVLAMLVDQKLAEQEIKRLGIQVTKEDVDRIITDIEKDSAMTGEQLRAAVAQEGLSWERYREQVYEQLCRARLINDQVRNKIVVSESRLVAYYDEHKEEFNLKEAAEIQQIMIAVPAGATAEVRELRRLKAQELHRLLSAGGDFATLAAAHSEAPSAKEGGDLGLVKLDDMAPYLKELVSRLKPGEISQVEQTSEGYQIFRLKSFRQGGLRPLSEVKDVIYNKLFQQEIDREYATWLKELRGRSYIKMKL